MQIRDSLTLDASGLTVTRDGYLVGDARVSRAGNVQMYRGLELGLTGADAARVFGVYRDPDVVFDERSMLSLAGRPVTRGHPPEGVDAATWKDLAVGQVGGVIRRDGEHVVAPMAIMDAEAVKEVMSGARALSAGYTVALTADEGFAPDGTPFQFRQSGELRFNHVAYLPDNNPRAGNTRIGDGADRWGASLFHQAEKKGSPMADNLHKMVVDGLPVDVTDAARAVIEKLQTTISDMAKKAEEMEEDKDKKLAAKDAEIAKKDAELADAKGKILDDAALDKLVKDRADLIGKAKAIDPKVVTDGKSPAEIKKAVVVAKRGAEMADKSEAYIDAAFDLLQDATDPVKAALGDAITTKVADRDSLYAKRDADLSNAWKTQKVEA